MTPKSLVITSRKDPAARAELDALVLKVQARKLAAQQGTRQPKKPA